MKTMALKPRVSEKAYAQSLANNTYLFNVPMDANKLTVAKAVAEQFSVTVEDVRVVVMKGKTKQSYRKGRRPVSGRRADVKKVYVTLKDGDKINIFGEEEKDKKKTDKATKADKTDSPKRETKSDAKDAKPRRSLGQVFGRSSRQTQDRGGGK